MLSNRSRYALRAMIHLAGLPGGGPATIADIAEASAAPRKFLEAILLDLRRQHLLASKRGRTGGYALARPAEAISFADVIRALEGPLALAPCASRTAYGPCETCPDVETCPLRPVLSDGRDALASVFEGRTLAQAVANA
ncbi:RrF2 family transcriptional regulator [Brevundimonas nasdae]|uniref:Rrf2 family transcriptional regulator n=1 Tax=Brevundimonas nasdae TaxID=172043 RepID=A0ABX8TJD2_9CAUL|nr:Rrf2 family transcriptional regulator [Brevundimonas nasdae]QYC10198.1 Rrf2 family transcriptional regulator [Brevundimonas nasdae]QYC12987.1 Rrf2 family transcriptional regulator [Brevundimonas nasdae]